VLLALPWTRDAGRAVTGAVSDLLWRVGRGIILAVPDLVTLGLIAALAIFALRLSGRFFAAVETGRLRFRTFEAEWATPTARIARLAILALAVVMAYPYIPGSSSEAFKAISILFGIMLSLGATSIVANVIAGQSLVYRGAFRVGDRIEVTGVVGDVEEMRSQVTFLRTPKNERVILPNSVLRGAPPARRGGGAW
jgi:small-conductance mechanosensitive channel